MAHECGTQPNARSQTLVNARQLWRGHAEIQLLTEMHRSSSKSPPFTNILPKTPKKQRALITKKKKARQRICWFSTITYPKQ